MMNFDLILNINFSETIKKNQVIIETYIGKILKLKSKQYSGLLRNVNINALSNVNNLLNEEFNAILKFLNDPSNVQVNKNQYMISNANVMGLEKNFVLKCLFYRKDKKSSVYKVETINYGKIPKKLESYEINGLIWSCENTEIYFDIKSSQNNSQLNSIETNFYIDLLEKHYPAKLVFNYGINYDGLSKNFGFENRIKNLLEKNNWKYNHDTKKFEYIGKNFTEDLSILINHGLNIYANNQKKITTGDFSNINVSYDIDWFGIKGKVLTNEEEIDISNLIDLNKKSQNWTEYNGKIILLPEVFKNKAIKNSDDGVLKIDKQNIIDALIFANKLNGKNIEKLGEYLDYEKINLEINKNIENILRPYQIIGIKWLMSIRENKFGGCLADDMGLGKTLQIIAFLSDKRFSKSINLIIVPKTLLMNWEKEFQKFLPDSSRYIYHGAHRDFNLIKSSNIILSTYGTVLNDIENFSKMKFDVLILDEAQYVKNSESKTYRALKQLDTKTKIILTGTPIENNLEEFWGLMKFINNIVPSFKIFQGLDEAQIKNKIKLFSSPFVLRREKKEVLKDLPEKQEQILYCEMGEKQIELYKNILDSIRYEILSENNKFKIKDNSMLLKGLLYLQEACCHPLLLNEEINKENCNESAKLEVLENILKNAYSTGHKIVIFSRFTKMLKIIEKRINFLHMNYFYLDGKTKNRISLVEEFEKSESGIFLISLKAGGTGINLVSADIAIIYDPWWNPAVEKQAEDRIYRIGQKNNVMIYKLITLNTIEEKIYELQNEKRDLFSQILNGHELPMKITLEFMRQLIL